MKARLENGQIIRYHRIPKTFLTILEYLPTIEGHNLDEDGNPTPYIERQGVWNAQDLTNDELKLFGFFDLIQEEYDPRVEEFGDIYFDENNQVFIEPKQDSAISMSLQECKDYIIKQYDDMMRYEFMKTDYHYIKNLELGTEIPSDITDRRTLLRSEINTVKSEINSFTTKKQVLSYNLPNYYI